MLLDRRPWYIAGPVLGIGRLERRAMIGVPVVGGLLAGVTLQRTLAARKNVEGYMPAPAATGL